MKEKIPSLRIPRGPIVKVSVSGGQARITIPKPLAIKMGLLTEDGKQGENTHVVFRDRTISPAKIEVE